PRALYPLSLHDALPISTKLRPSSISRMAVPCGSPMRGSDSLAQAGGASASSCADASAADGGALVSWSCRVVLLRPHKVLTSSLPDRKSTRLNSSHQIIS